MNYEAVVERIARECHEANKSYCEFIGDTSQPSWEDAPEWQKDSARNGVKAHLSSTAADPMTPRKSHESWMKQKSEEGWKYGPTKDPAKKEHPCMVDYDELPLVQRTKDLIFGVVVRILEDALPTTDEPAD